MRCYLLNKNCHLQSNKRFCSIGVQTQAAGAGGSLLQASSWIIRVTDPLLRLCCWNLLENLNEAI